MEPSALPFLTVISSLLPVPHLSNSALMGESGAGKTTLLDVIAMRKGSGEITGEILLNGFPQETVSFR